MCSFSGENRCHKTPAFYEKIGAIDFYITIILSKKRSDIGRRIVLGVMRKEAIQ
jgi:hypothetical protein